MELSKLTSLLLTNSAPLTKPSLFRSRSYEPTARPPAPARVCAQKTKPKLLLLLIRTDGFPPRSGPVRRLGRMEFGLVAFALYFELEYEGRGNLTLDIPRRITACFGPRTLLLPLLLLLLGLRWVDPDVLPRLGIFRNWICYLRSKGVRY